MKRKFKILIIVFLTIIIAAGIFYVWLSRQYVIPVIMYHSVDNPRHYSGIIVSPNSFRKQMEFLRKRKYNVISLKEMVDIIKSRKHLLKKSVVITFDDGYVDNYTHAYPILKEYDFPAAIFVIANLVDKKGYVTWDELREMEKSGITIGSHTLDHVYLPGIPSDWQSHQIVDSKKMIEKNLGHRIDYFAYPSGGYSDGTKDLVEQAGYQAACTTNRGNDRFNRDLYELKRVRFKDKDLEIVMWFKLSGYYNFFRILKEPN